MKPAKKSGKIRADKLVLERGLAGSREKAQALILAGSVYSGEIRIEKPGHLVQADIPLELRGDPCPYVSRGGLKLEGALKAFGISPEGLVCVDNASYAGGFTHCLLTRNAGRVYAVDVGKNLLDGSLRNDGRVVVMEGRDARHMTADEFPEPVDLVVVDASFISLRLLLPAIAAAAPDAAVIALVKPQFEVGRSKVGKGGIVREDGDRREAVRAIIDAAATLGYRHEATVESPIRGRKGNVEFLIHLLPEEDRST